MWWFSGRKITAVSDTYWLNLAAEPSISEQSAVWMVGLFVESELIDCRW